MQKIISREECCFCGACSAICPVGAISFRKDEMNQELIIEQTKCINCKKCEKVCPVLNADKLKNNSNDKCYAYRTNDDENLLKSSSGGAFYDIAKAFDDGNTIFVGAKTDGTTVYHDVAYSINEAKAFRKSKYVKSSTLDIFEKITTELKEGKQVLFSGTPCQNAAIKSYLKGNDSSVLYVDVICHGTPSEFVLNKYFHDKFNKKTVDNFEFRNKEKYNNIFVTKIVQNGKEKYLMLQENEYLQAFLSGYLYMEGCYNCKFASTCRVSDITIGDFWGIETLDCNIKSSGGVSLIIANTEKGQRIVDKLQGKIKKEFDLEDAIKYNGNLVSPTPKKVDEDAIMQELCHNDFCNAVDNIVPHKNKLKLFIRKHMPNKILNLLRK